MSEDVNVRLVKVEHRQDTLEMAVHESVGAQKQTNEAINGLSTQLARTIDKFDMIIETQKEQGKQQKDNTSRIDKMEASNKLFNSIITAVVIAAILIGLNLK